MLPWIIGTILGAGIGTAAYFIGRWLWDRYSQKLKDKAEEAKRKLQQFMAERAALAEQEERERKARREKERQEEAARREKQRREHEAREKAKEGKVKEVLQSDDELARQLMRMGGIDPKSSPYEILNDPELVKKMAKELSDLDLAMLSIAAAQKDIEFDLEKKSERILAPYPTADMEPAFLTSIDQLHNILTEEWVYDDEVFYSRLAEQELRYLQAFEEIFEQKMLYILYDASPSMDELMSNGLPRHIWARGVVLNLLIRAVKGQAKYFFRPFATYPLELTKVTTKEEAAKLIDALCRATPRDSGTNITTGIKQATEDIRTLGGELTQADILLISDCEDNSTQDTERLKGFLQGDPKLHVAIKLHVALIGKQANSHLKAVASSYKVFK